MTTLDGRVYDIVRTLSARERAVLVMRAWTQGDREDWRLEHLMERGEKPEFDRLLKLADAANIRIGGELAHWQWWIIDADQNLAWAESLEAWQRRCEQLEGRLAEAGLDVPERALGRLEHGLTPAMPLLYGKSSGREHSEDPPPIEELPRILVDAALTSLPLRWAELAAVERIHEEISQAEFLGTSITHHQLKTAIEDCRQLLRDLHQRLVLRGEDATLPEPSFEDLEWTRATIDWHPPAPVADSQADWLPSRWSLTPGQREELDALEEWLRSSAS